ncbi:hypothetical protein BFP72_12570 [Reichenbachiella sp. 5M10]|uniref:hypothetical protein n=1 Tax=Reichenbachiella sp. 5M10 TaxID=1889772 RepID=UPI000C146CEF|nr:hypothetical protein [Reichenbachiella sp. 5M10]PIB36170.1 hypothetical protein BFP72_12570 [Reichenbachiella sp. 5M10]
MNNFHDLITFGDLRREEDEYVVPLTIDATHDVFDGHFPQHPVLPGVVTMEVLRRALELATQQKLRLSTAANIKFLGMIDPRATPEMVMRFSVTDSDDGLKVKASLRAAGDDSIVFKQQATFHVY